jgi:hypothetical protein
MGTQLKEPHRKGPAHQVSGPGPLQKFRSFFIIDIIAYLLQQNTMSIFTTLTYTRRLTPVMSSHDQDSAAPVGVTRPSAARAPR